MRIDRVTLLLILTVPLLTGADLTGHWVSQPAGPGQVSIWLESKGGSLGGYLVTPQGPVPIGDSSVRGNSFAFAVMREYFGEERRVIYTGTITDAGLKLLIPGLGGGENDRMVVLTRISTDAPKQILPPLPKIRLAPAPDVPNNGLAKTP